MSKLKIHHWVGDESVVYNIESGDMHLLSSFNAELLALMLEKIETSLLIKKIIENYQVDKQEAESFLDDLYLEYQNLNLIDK